MTEKTRLLTKNLANRNVNFELYTDILEGIWRVLKQNGISKVKRPGESFKADFRDPRGRVEALKFEMSEQASCTVFFDWSHGDISINFCCRHQAGIALDPDDQTALEKIVADVHENFTGQGEGQ